MFFLCLCFYKLADILPPPFNYPCLSLHLTSSASLCAGRLATLRWLWLWGVVREWAASTCPTPSAMIQSQESGNHWPNYLSSPSQSMLSAPSAMTFWCQVRTLLHLLVPVQWHVYIKAWNENQPNCNAEVSIYLCLMMTDRQSDADY